MKIKGKIVEKETKEENALAGISLKVLREVANDCDGHSILCPDKLVESGLPIPFVVKNTEVIKSDFSDHKSTLFVDGEPVKSLTGVWALGLLKTFVWNLGVDSAAGTFFGRGRQADADRAAVLKWIDEQEATGRTHV